MTDASVREPLQTGHGAIMGVIQTDALVCDMRLINRDLQVTSTTEFLGCVP